jgi:hypothetical protein
LLFTTRRAESVLAGPKSGLPRLYRMPVNPFTGKTGNYAQRQKSAIR